MKTSESQTVTILAHDPGSHNYGIAVIRVELPEDPDRKVLLKGLGFSVLYASKMEHSFTTLKDAALADREMIAYLNELEGLRRKYNPDLQIAERYMSRRMGGVTIELVNMLLGTLRVFSLRRGIPIRLIPASQWKNELKRREVDLKEVYKEAKREHKRTPHEVDAVMIGLYGAFSLMKLKAFSVEDPHRLVNSVLHKLRRLELTRR